MNTNAPRFSDSVPHPALVLSRAAGHTLSPELVEGSKGVDPPKGPVLLNYGIEECRFLKPVYPGSTCHPGQACPGHRTGDPGQVKFIPAHDRDRLCREKLDQASSAEAPWRSRKKRRKLSGNPRSPALAGTEDSPKGTNPAGAGQVVARGKACPGPRPGVKWLVDVVDETGETVAPATILTMVKKLDQK